MRARLTPSETKHRGRSRKPNALSTAVAKAGQWFFRIGDGDLNLAPAEGIVKDSYGDLIGRLIGVRGRIVLTDRRLVFLSQAPRGGTDQVRLDIELAIVEDAATTSVWDVRAAMSPFLPFSVTAAGETYRYRSPDADELVALIQTILPRS